MPTAPIYAVGDIHGQLEMLETALDRIRADGGKDARIVFVGDLVDRGASSCQVIDLLMSGQAEGRNWTVLRGNHDDLFLRFLRTGKIEDSRIKSGVPWTGPRLGGLTTLASYGITDLDRPAGDLWVDAKARVPNAHIEYLQSLPCYALVDDLLFVHAGIRPGIALTDQTDDDLMWIRAEFLDDTRRHPWLVVHGHTAVEAPEHKGNRVNLDSGAGYGRQITAAVFENGQVWTLAENGRVPLRP